MYSHTLPLKLASGTDDDYENDCDDGDDDDDDDKVCRHEYCRMFDTLHETVEAMIPQPLCLETLSPY